MRTKLLYWVKRNPAVKDSLKLLIGLSRLPQVLAAFIAAKLDRQMPDHVWLVGEMGMDAKDNGYAFFKFLKREHPEINAVYYLDPSVPVAAEVTAVGQIVPTNSFAHMKMMFKADFIFSSQDMYAIPWGRINWREFKLLYGWLNPKLKYIFLQHGIMQSDASKNANYRRTKFDRFITSTNREFADINSEKYGYPEGHVIKTGLARYDELMAARLAGPDQDGDRHILVMPTWRQYLADVDEATYQASEFYATYNRLLTDPEILALLDTHQLQLDFYPPHLENQKFLHLFDDTHPRVNLLPVAHHSVREALVRSSYLITDYSSVAFDFSYLNRPITYYQFDAEKFHSGHYKQGYFSYQNDGMGPVLANFEQMLAELKANLDRNFVVADMYQGRAKDFYAFVDANNSKRIFENVQAMQDVYE